MSPKILIIGSTGQLGSKIIKYCASNNILISTITCFNNDKKMNSLAKKYKINNKFKLSNKKEYLDFIRHIKINKFDIIYILDFGSESLFYIDILIRHNKGSFISIANKELIIAGGSKMITSIRRSNNNFIPLDSEHFSLLNSNFSDSNIQKIYITASGGPFFFKKKVDLNGVTIKQVLKHPKWKMGINNSIDSSNFINKILELYELSSIFDIDIKKIDFLVSKEAYVHSIIVYKSGLVTLNCFNNDMLIPMIFPLTYFCDLKYKSPTKYLNTKNFKLDLFDDKRFKIYKKISFLKKLDHHDQIKFMLLNNIAQKKYLNNEICYQDIINFIYKNLKKDKKKCKLRNFSDITNYIKNLKSYYEKI